MTLWAGLTTTDALRFAADVIALASVLGLIVLGGNKLLARRVTRPRRPLNARREYWEGD